MRLSPLLISTKYLSAGIAAALLLSGCHPATNESNRSSATADLQQEYCYQLVRSMDNIQDTSRLQIIISGDSAQGWYVWTIPGKDGKTGKFEGSFTAGSIEGHYHYVQEGNTYVDSIRIIFAGQTVIVQQNPEEKYPLTDTLLKLEKCSGS